MQVSGRIDSYFIVRRRSDRYHLIRYENIEIILSTNIGSQFAKFQTTYCTHHIFFRLLYFVLKKLCPAKTLKGKMWQPKMMTFDPNSATLTS